MENFLRFSRGFNKEKRESEINKLHNRKRVERRSLKPEEPEEETINTVEWKTSGFHLEKICCYTKYPDTSIKVDGNKTCFE